MFKGGLGGMMKKAQEMQENMQRMQKELVHKTVVGQSGAGGVKVTLNGHYGCERVEIADELWQEEREMLEALVAAAVSDATQKTKALVEAEMAKLTGGMNLPDGFKMPF
ncbi:YbaB/EbfC family nucleoid-associated protein [Rappaport israeli]|uniref:YbaB/EbfC family nucleoid-associated protein n=1 Tax=Rappaport israeli TaxID=1839807 RepID=UPI0009302051|nr:YbaB/EbfC family nucleoid-associated protein [Rappaport israeli]